MRCTNVFTPSHWLKCLAVSFHLIHGHSHTHWCLSVLFLLSLYFLLKFLFHLFLLLAMVPDDSMNDPLCHSAIGSMVTSDYCTPDTFCGPKDRRFVAQKTDVLWPKRPTFCGPKDRRFVAQKTDVLWPKRPTFCGPRQDRRLCGPVLQRPTFCGPC